MSILNRPGWANRSIINEGRLHSDELKQRITNLFQRTSLGNSPTYTVGKIADLLRREKGDDISINEITDEDIIRIANYGEVTNNKFSPKLKDDIINSRKETQEEISSNSSQESPSSTSESEISSETDIEDLSYENEEDYDLSDISSDTESEIGDYNEVDTTEISTEFSPETDELEFAGAVASEDSEEKKKKGSCSCNKEQRPPDEPKMNTILSKVKKESVKLSPKAVNKLLMENYIKSKQHKFRVEERYRY